jgi:CHRD domain
MTQKNKLFIILLLTFALSVGTMSIFLSTTHAQGGAQSFTATLQGNANKSNSTGIAKFQVNEDNSRVSYWLNVTGIKKINEAHIHNGSQGQSGDILVSLLSKSKSAKGGTSSPEIDFSGNISKRDLRGELEGKDISDLVSLMSNGSAYVNIHTDKYPKGAIRGQIASASVNEVRTTPPPSTNETNATAATTTPPPSTNETKTSIGQSASSNMTNTSVSNMTSTNAMTPKVSKFPSNQSTSVPNLDIDESMR